MRNNSLLALLLCAPCYAAQPVHEYNYVLGKDTCFYKYESFGFFNAIFPCQSEESESRVAIRYESGPERKGIEFRMWHSHVLAERKQELMKAFPAPDQILLEGPKRSMEIYLEGKKVITVQSPLNVIHVSFGLPVVARKIGVVHDAINDIKKINIDLGKAVTLDAREDTRKNREALMVNGMPFGHNWLPQREDEKPIDQANVMAYSRIRGGPGAILEGTCLSSDAIGKIQKLELVMSGVGEDNKPLTVVSAYLDDPAYSFHVDAGMLISEAMGDPGKPTPDFSVICTTTQGKKLTDVQIRKYKPRYNKMNPGYNKMNPAEGF